MKVPPHEGNSPIIFTKSRKIAFPLALLMPSVSPSGHGGQRGPHHPNPPKQPLSWPSWSTLSMKPPHKCPQRRQILTNTLKRRLTYWPASGLHPVRHKALGAGLQLQHEDTRGGGGGIVPIQRHLEGARLPWEKRWGSSSLHGPCHVEADFGKPGGRALGEPTRSGGEGAGRRKVVVGMCHHPVPVQDALGSFWGAFWWGNLGFWWDVLGFGGTSLVFGGVSLVFGGTSLVLVEYPWFWWDVLNFWWDILVFWWGILSFWQDILSFGGMSLISDGTSLLFSGASLVFGGTSFHEPLREELGVPPSYLPSCCLMEWCHRRFSRSG